MVRNFSHCRNILSFPKCLPNKYALPSGRAYNQRGSAKMILLFPTKMILLLFQNLFYVFHSSSCQYGAILVYQHEGGDVLHSI